MPLALPANTWKATMGFVHPDGVAGWTENYYIKSTSPSGPVPSVLDPIILALVTARKAALVADSIIKFVRVSILDATARRMAYLSPQNVAGTIAKAADVWTMPVEVVALFRMQGIVTGAPGHVYRTMHYIGGIPSSAIVVGGPGLDPGGWAAGAAATWIAALVSNCVMVAKIGGILVAVPFTSGAITELRSRNRGRPLGVWHGIHGH
jgi:hypothetical protein